MELLLTGDFESCFTAGDNSEILPTDTMKNTVYSRARESAAECIEDFARELAEFILARNPQVASARVAIASTPWEHALVEGKPSSLDLYSRHQRVTNDDCYLCAGRWGGCHLGLRESGIAQDRQLRVRGLSARLSYHSAGDRGPPLRHRGAGAVEVSISGSTLRATAGQAA